MGVSSSARSRLEGFLSLVVFLIGVLCMSILLWRTRSSAGPGADDVGLQQWPLQDRGVLFASASVRQASGVAVVDRVAYFVGDHGKLVAVSWETGNVTQSWDLAPSLHDEVDFEGLTFVPGRPQHLYLVREYPSAVVEFNIERGQVDRVFDMQPLIGPILSKNRLLEGIAFVPDPGNSEGGYFLVMRQDSGVIFQIQIPLLSSNVSTVAMRLGTAGPYFGYQDIGDADFNPCNGLLYILYDTVNVLLLVDWFLPGKPPVARYSVPSWTDNQEGLAVLGCGPEAVLLMAFDNDGVPPFHAAWRYSMEGRASQCSPESSVSMPASS